MRYVSLALLFSFVAFFAKGQANTFPPSGNVGIGTTSPLGKLDINQAGGQLRLSGGTIAGGVWTSATGHLYLADWSTGTKGLSINMSSGNVGMGSTSPASKLHIADGTGGEQLRFSRGTGVLRFSQGLDRDDLYLYNRDASKTFMFWREDGNVGIGTTFPLAKLDVDGGVRVSTTLDVGGTRNSNSASGGLNIYDYFTGEYTNIQFAQSGWGGSNAILFNAYKAATQVNGDLRAIGNVKHSNDEGPYSAGSGMIHYLGNGGRMDFFLSGNSPGRNSTVNWPTPVISLVRDGNVGIGIINPTQKLQVKGTVYSTEVKVDLAAGTGPDYVFEPTYDLKPLAEIETYIKENKHLPEVPSAKEMEKNGVQLGEMNMLLLKKVEELTLYVIELKKRDEAQQKEIEKLKKNKD